MILIPQLSESACVANTRMSPLDGVNMNRAFPGNPRGTISSRIANFVKKRIFPLGRVVIDIHAGGKEGAFPICASFHPIPDPTQRAEIATASRLFDTPFAFIYASTMASGLLTDEAEAEGKITIGGEFGGGETTNRSGVRHAYEGVRNVLKHYGQLEGEVDEHPRPGAPEQKLVRADQLDSYVPCPRDGVWEPTVDLGEFVDGRTSSLADCTISPITRPAIEIRSPRAGYVADDASERAARQRADSVCHRGRSSPGARCRVKITDVQFFVLKSDGLYNNPERRRAPRPDYMGIVRSRPTKALRLLRHGDAAPVSPRPASMRRSGAKSRAWSASTGSLR